MLFDLDGVLTPTAAVHERAWTAMFDRFLATAAPDQPGFSAEDYRRYVDGRPRFDGVQAFLVSRGLSLPEGTESDPGGLTTVGALGNLKNDLFNEA
ncbi:MAG TPA: haloacid dehalogenase, partial [Ilumatobacteraceae bacterium]|nr:haloacid dehalogenase [Ilumatobacteraceae bacterium]